MMISKISPALFALAVAMSAAPVAHAQAQEAPDAAPVVLSATDAVTPVRLTAGATATLRLESNPSTGYGWQLVEAVNLDVEQPFEIVSSAAASQSVPVVGAPGTAVIRITPLAKGPASLTLTYAQPWSGGSTAQTLLFVFDVE